MSQPNESEQTAFSDVLLRTIEAQVDIARTALLGFRRPDGADFLRDTTSTSPTPADCLYPTATFVSFCALDEADLLCPPSSSAPTSDPWQFVARLKERGSLDQVIAQSAINPKEAELRWNIYSAAYGVCAIVAAYQSLQRVRPDAASTTEGQELSAWIEAQIREQLLKFEPELQKKDGVSLPGGHGHPFLTYVAVDAWAKATQALPQLPEISEKIRSGIRDLAEQRAHRIIARHTIEAASPGELVALAYYACLLDCEGIGPPSHKPLVEHALDVLCHSQASGTGWPLGRSLRYSAGGSGVQVSSFDIGARLLDLSTKMQERHAEIHPSSYHRDSAFLTLFRGALRSFSEVTVRDRTYRGWRNDDTYAYDVVESWTTALVLQFLIRFLRYAELSTNHRMLRKYNTVWPVEMGDWRPLNELDDPDPSPKLPMLQYLEERFVSSLRSHAGATRLPSESDSNVSFVLFGPPGTGKTSIVRGIAGQLKWPLVTITPSLFLSRGQDNIDSQANEVFSQLMQCSRIVVLFDECDELFRQRPSLEKSADLSTAGLITGAMLPRLQELHARGKLIFALATNRIRVIDTAVRRQGRFDELIGVGPPEHAARLRILERSYGEAPHKQRIAIAEMTNGFTRAELIEVIRLMERLRREPPALPFEDTLEKIRNAFPSDGLTILPDVKTAFEKDCRRFSGLHRQRSLLAH